VEGKRSSECLLKPVSNIDFNPIKKVEEDYVQHQRETAQTIQGEMPFLSSLLQLIESLKAKKFCDMIFDPIRVFYPIIKFLIILCLIFVNFKKD
jgi:hypothetical protein